MNYLSIGAFFQISPMKTQAVPGGRIYDGLVPVQIPGPGFESRTGQSFSLRFVWK